jgi:hypothetical protein
MAMEWVELDWNWFRTEIKKVGEVDRSLGYKY